MNTPDFLNTDSKNLLNLILKNWEELDDSLKTKLIKISFESFNLGANSFFFLLKNEYVNEKLFVPILLQY